VKFTDHAAFRPERRGQLKVCSAVQRKWVLVPKLELLLQMNTSIVALQAAIFTTARQLYLFWVKIISSTLSNPISFTVILIVSSRLPYDFQAHSSFRILHQNTASLPMCPIFRCVWKCCEEWQLPASYFSVCQLSPSSAARRISWNLLLTDVPKP